MSRCNTVFCESATDVNIDPPDSSNNTPSLVQELDDREREALRTPGMVAPAPAEYDGRPGSINVSSILTGKLIAKIQAVPCPVTSAERCTAEALSGAHVAAA